MDERERTITVRVVLDGQEYVPTATENAKDALRLALADMQHAGLIRAWSLNEETGGV